MRLDLSTQHDGPSPPPVWGTVAITTLREIHSVSSINVPYLAGVEPLLHECKHNVCLVYHKRGVGLYVGVSFFYR